MAYFVVMNLIADGTKTVKPNPGNFLINNDTRTNYRPLTWDIQKWGSSHGGTCCGCGQAKHRVASHFHKDGSIGVLFYE